MEVRGSGPTLQSDFKKTRHLVPGNRAFPGVSGRFGSARRQMPVSEVITGRSGRPDGRFDGHSGRRERPANFFQTLFTTFGFQTFYKIFL